MIIGPSYGATNIYITTDNGTSLGNAYIPISTSASTITTVTSNSTGSWYKINPVTASIKPTNKTCHVCKWEGPSNQFDNHRCLESSIAYMGLKNDELREELERIKKRAMVPRRRAA